MRIALMVTCLGEVLRPQAPQAVVRILQRLGHSVTCPAAQTCCGQPFWNSGFPELARRQAEQMLTAFPGDEPVVTPSGSCAAMIKAEYPRLFPADSPWHSRAIALSNRVQEFSSFLVRTLGVVDVGAKYAGKVAFHYACHLRMLGHAGEAEELIRHVHGATLVPLTRQDQCCGFGGSFAVRYPEISGAMVEDKAQCAVASGADVLVSTDTGCLMNIGGRLRRGSLPVAVLHLAELLDSR